VIFYPAAVSEEVLVIIVKLESKLRAFKA